MAGVGARVSSLPHECAGAARQAFRILHFGFVAAPLLAGADKFANILTDWTIYLAPVVPDTLGVSAQTFMYIVGAVEIVAGLLVAVRPAIGALVVAAWLVGIIVNLLILGAFYDVALRDFGLFLGAIALARLACGFAHSHRGEAHPAA